MTEPGLGEDFSIPEKPERDSTPKEFCSFLNKLLRKKGHRPLGEEVSGGIYTDPNLLRTLTIPRSEDHVGFTVEKRRHPDAAKGIMYVITEESRIIDPEEEAYVPEDSSLFIDFDLPVIATVTVDKENASCDLNGVNHSGKPSIYSINTDRLFLNELQEDLSESAAYSEPAITRALKTMKSGVIRSSLPTRLFAAGFLTSFTIFSLYAYDEYAKNDSPASEYIEDERAGPTYVEDYTDVEIASNNEVKPFLKQFYNDVSATSENDLEGTVATTIPGARYGIYDYMHYGVDPDNPESTGIKTIVMTENGDTLVTDLRVHRSTDAQGQEYCMVSLEYVDAAGIHHREVYSNSLITQAQGADSFFIFEGTAFKTGVLAEKRLEDIRLLSATLLKNAQSHAPIAPLAVEIG